MAGCFGGSAIDRWMESNLNDYLGGDDAGERTCSFKLYKGKKLISEWDETISNEDSSYHEMKERLVSVHTKILRKYLYEIDPMNHVAYSSTFRCYMVYDPETDNFYRCDSFRKDRQEKILANWAMLPKTFNIERGNFAMLRMGKYSVVANDPSGEH